MSPTIESLEEFSSAAATISSADSGYPQLSPRATRPGVKIKQVDGKLQTEGAAPAPDLEPSTASTVSSSSTSTSDPLMTGTLHGAHEGLESRLQQAIEKLGQDNLDKKGLANLDIMLNSLLSFQISNLMPDLTADAENATESALSSLSAPTDTISDVTSIARSGASSPLRGASSHYLSYDSEGDTSLMSADEEMLKLDLTSADELFKTMIETDPDTASWLQQNYPSLFE